MNKAVGKLMQREPRGKKVKKMAKKIGREVDRGIISIFDYDLEKRTINRDVRGYEREEKKLLKEIKAAAAKKDDRKVKMLAKQLVKVRKNKDKVTAATYKMDDVKYAAKGMAANVAVAESMTKATKVVKKINNMAKPEKLMKTMQEYEMEMEKANIKEEMMDDALGELDEDGLEMEDEIVNQVLAEAGLEMTADLQFVPTGGLQNEEKEQEDEAELGLPALEV